MLPFLTPVFLYLPPLPPPYRTSSILYTVDSRHQWGTIVNGKIQVQDGTHITEQKILEGFLAAMKVLQNR